MGVLAHFPTPADGESAYDIWLSLGHIGTEAQFLEWLKGEQGDQGIPGPIPQLQWQGTKQRWLQQNGWSPLGPDLKGPKGDQGDQGPMPDISALGGVQPFIYNGAGSAAVQAGGHGSYSKVGNMVVVNTGFSITNPFAAFTLPTPALAGINIPITFEPMTLVTEAGRVIVGDGSNVATIIISGATLPFVARSIRLSFSYLGQ